MFSKIFLPLEEIILMNHIEGVLLLTYFNSVLITSNININHLAERIKIMYVFPIPTVLNTYYIFVKFALSVYRITLFLEILKRLFPFRVPIPILEMKIGNVLNIFDRYFCQNAFFICEGI